MRYLSAQYVFTNSGPPLKRGIITIGDDGTILGIESTGGDLHERHSVEFYNGIIMPGFVNLASNDKPDILGELKTLQHNFPTLSLTDLIALSTIKGAKVTGDHKYGKIEKGAKPGLFLLQNVDLINLKLLEDSYATRLV